MIELVFRQSPFSKRVVIYLFLLNQLNTYFAILLLRYGLTVR
jgi:hypothetical protein